MSWRFRARDLLRGGGDLPPCLGLFGRVGFLTLCMLACVAPQGGWDVAALVDRSPALETFPGHRLGDLVPFPVLQGDRVQLVVCRFETEEPVRVRSISGAAFGRHAVLVQRATDAISLRVPGLALHWREGALSAAPAVPAPPAPPTIWIQAEATRVHGGPHETGALGNTQSECDVTSEADTGIRGTILQAAIRMRSQTANYLGRVRPATDEEWLGALMHEFGHAAGFIGHVASGGSLMVREESTLRRWGQRELTRRDGRDSEVLGRSDQARGEGAELEPTLSALYAISPGTVLGERVLSERALTELARLRTWEEMRARQGVDLVRVVAMAGDRDARIEWRFADGSQAGVWFRGWAAALRAGGGIDAKLDLQTRRALIEAGL